MFVWSNNKQINNKSQFCNVLWEAEMFATRGTLNSFLAHAFAITWTRRTIEAAILDSC